ncbi:MAG TPA: N-acyl homoserine lactonase family protein [Sphingopyxis sp.]|nr:N-acyl homoserine lactonase family protein [Sphingopyxis sp.]
MSVRLYGMTCGWLTMPFGFFLPGAEGWLAIPVPAYLIVHPKGTAIFDTGLETALQSKDPGEVDATLGAAAGYALPTFEAGEDVGGRLRDFGVDPERIDYVINSHLHLDHCGGNAMIPNARLVIQKREWEASRTPELIVQNHYTPRHYDLGHDRLEIDGEHDLFGDGSVVLLPTFGHTPGHQSVRVKLADGEVVLAADACYLRETLEKMLLPDPGVVSNADAMRENYAFLRQIEKQGGLIVFGHDPDQWRHLNSGPVEEITSAAVLDARRTARPNRPEALASPFIGR